ncbi:hypothetical protein LguiA_003761 [Lonicera macranthoides]
MWKPRGDYSLMELGNDFLFRSEDEDTIDRVLYQGPWIISGNYVAVQKWQPGFIASKDPSYKVDDNTYWATRGKFARICMKVDFGKPVTSMIVVDGIKLMVEYENVSAMCFGCGRIGHRVETCLGAINDINGKHNSSDATEPGKVLREENIDFPKEGPFREKDTFMNTGIPELEYGPWMIV